MKKGRCVQGIESGDAKIITKKLHDLFVLLKEENGQVLRFVKEEKAKILARKERLNKFPKNHSLESIIPWIIDNTLFRSSLMRKIDEDLEKVVAIEQCALLQEKNFEYLINNFASMSAGEIYGEMHNFITNWYLKTIPKNERDRIIQFPLDVRVRNVHDTMVTLGVAATQV